MSRNSSLRLRAADVMATEMVATHQDATIREAAALLVEHGISGAPVRDEFGRIVGVIGLRDIARFETTMAEDPAHVRQFMTPIPLTVPEAASLDEVVDMLLEHRIHGLLVRNESGDITGRISALDVLGALVHSQS